MSAASLTTALFPSTSVLGAMPNAAREALAGAWRANSFRKGEFIIGEQENCSDIAFLIEGSARVAIFTASGRELSVQTLSAGDCFGEFSAIDGSPRSANIEAMSNCVAARLTSAEFRALLEQSPALSIAFMKLLVAKLRTMTHTMSDISDLTANARIGQAVLDMAQTAAGQSNMARIDAPPTQSEMAARLFSNREAVAREMGRMKRKGVIQRDGRAILVPNLEALEDYVDTLITD